MKVTIISTILSLAILSPGISTAQTQKKLQTEEATPEFSDIVDTHRQVSGQSLGLYTKADKYYMAVPDAVLNRPVIIFSRLVKSYFGSGYQADDLVGEPTTFKWVKEGKELAIYQENYKVLLPDSSTSIYEAVHSVNRPKKIGRYPIVSHAQEGDICLVDVTGLLQGNELLPFPAKNIRKVDLSEGRVSLEAPANLPAPPAPKAPVTLRMGERRLYIEEPGKGGEAILKTIFYLLPEQPMALRPADDRVGYQTMTFQDFGGYNQQVRERKAALRWDISVKKPLTVHIDPLTPKKWLPYIIKGVEAWQEPFTAIGLKNVIRIKVISPDDTTDILQSAPFAVTYGLRPVNEKGYSMVVDPRSGEIIQAHVGFDHSSIAQMENQYRLLAGINDADARKVDFPEQLTGRLIQTRIMQQIGAALGLTDNLIASAAYPVDSLRNAVWLAQYGTMASVMDIGGINYVAQPEDHLQPEYLLPRIGPYDFWAIAWGYSPSIPESFRSGDPHQSLQRWTSQQQKNAELRWQNSMTNSPATEGNDPRALVNDLGDNSIKASTYGIRNLQRTFKELPTWVSPQDVAHIEDLYKQLFSENGIYAGYIRHVLALIGGKYSNAAPGASADGADIIVSRQVQKEAMDFLKTYFFQTPDWAINKAVVANMNESGLSNLQQLQKSVIKSLIEEKTEILSRQEMVFGKDVYTIAEMFADLQEMILPKSYGGERLDIYQRMLQSNYVDVLLEYKGKNGRGTASSQIGYQLSILKEQIDACIHNTTDPETKAHFEGLLYNLNK